MEELTEEDEQVNEERIKEIQELDSDLKKGFKNLLVKPRIGMYLKALGFKFKWSEEYKSFLVPLQLSIKGQQEGEKKEKKQKQLVMLQTKGMWLSMRVGLLGKKQIPEEKKEDLWKSLLLANSKNPEFSFSINEEGDVGYSQDIFLPALNFDVFMEEFLTIPQAVQYFWSEIFPKLQEMEEEEISFLYT